MTIHLIHGFNVSDGGRGSVGRLIPFIGDDVVLHDYGWTGLFLLRFTNDYAVREILRKLKPGDVIVGHSNGALICWKLAQILGKELGGVIVINPALRKDTLWPEGLPVLCIHNSTDWVVQLGRVWSRLVSLGGLNFHGWGAAGRYGFTTSQGLVSNYDSADGEIWARPVTGHSGLFDEAEYWGGIIDRWVSLSRNASDASHLQPG